MNSKIICLLGAIVVCFGCVQNFPSTVTSPCPPYTYNPLVTSAPQCGNSNLAFDPLDTAKAALPDLKDLPPAPIVNTAGPARKYTGIIKNKTKYEVSVPSLNSGATLIIPARGWIEYVAYERQFDVTAYHDGKPFYCLKVCANPRDYEFMCSKYDFMAEIVKPEPKSTYPGKKMKRYKKKVVEG